MRGDNHQFLYESDKFFLNFSALSFKYLFRWKSMDLWIFRSFNHRNLRIFESWTLEIATQKLTKLRNNPQHSLSLNENILHLIIITFPLLLSIIIVAFMLLFPPSSLLSRQIYSKIILPSSCISWRDERLGENPHFPVWDSRDSTTTEKRTALFIWRSIATQNSPSSAHSLISFSRFFFSR